MNEFGMGFQMNERYKSMSECNERKTTKRERNGMSLERGFKEMVWNEFGTGFQRNGIQWRERRKEWNEFGTGFQRNGMGRNK